MNLETTKQQLPDFAKDIKLNLNTILTTEGAPDLSLQQIFGIALASAYTTKQAELISVITTEASQHLDATMLEAAKSAAVIMAMNNIYYRFVHLATDKSYSTMPAKLRMNVIGNPGIPKVDFELYSLAVSAINGCGMCIDAHAKELEKAGITKQGIQSTVRIASVINAAATAIALM